MHYKAKELEESIEKFNKKFNTQSPFDWIEKIEKLERLVDEVKVCNPVNWLGLREDMFDVWIHRGSNHIISPIQAWEQNHEKIAKYFPDFSKADLPIQVAFTRCFFFYVDWMYYNKSNFIYDYTYSTFDNLDRTAGSIPFFHYSDGEDFKNSPFNKLYFIRRIFKGRAKGGLAVGFLHSIQYLNNLLNSNSKDDFLFYWIYDGKVDKPYRILGNFNIEFSEIRKINDELFDSYHHSKNPYNKKIINDVLLLAQQWLPVCMYLHEQGFDRFRKATKQVGVNSLLNAKKELKKELSLTTEEVLEKYDQRMVELVRTIKESKNRDNCF